MARNVNETEENEENTSIIKADPFDRILKRINSLKRQGKEVSGKISEELTRAETTHNLDKKAFAVVAGCTRMEPARLNAFLRNFDAYREYADLDGKAGADLFEGKPKGHAAKANGHDKPPAKAAKRPKAPGKAPKKKKAPEPAERTTFSEAARKPGMVLADAMHDAILSHETETAGQG